MKSRLEKNDIEMYSTHNEGKPVVAERFIRTIKNKIYKHMTSISKNVYIINNTKHRTTKMKPTDAKDKHILTLVKRLMIMILSLKLVIT